MFGLEPGPTWISGLIARTAGPLFRIVSVRVETAPIRACAPVNRRAVVDKAIDAGKKPVPEREMTCGLPGLFEPIVRVPFRAPAPAGVNRMRRVQEAATPSVLP